MTLEADVNTDTNSSGSVETLDASLTTDDVITDLSADSSTADGVSAEKDTMSVVRDVVDGRESDKAVASPAKGGEEGVKPDDPAKKEPDDENYTDVPFNKHPRFQQLVQKVKTYKVDAERYQSVQTFMDQNGLAAQEVADGLIIMGLIKQDPLEAWKRLQPVVQNLLVACGEILPEDLLGRVQRGELSQETALELNRERAKTQNLHAQRSFHEQQAEKRASTERSETLRNTAISWAEDRQAKDPNFEAKFIPIQKELAFIQSREGKPTTPEGVLDQLKRAYDAVILPVASANQQARPMNVRNTRPSVGSVSGNANPAPQSTLDIVDQVLAAR